MADLSLRAYARHRDCALNAVQQAIHAGRLVKSVKRDGAGVPKIRSAEEADAEWKASTRSERIPISADEATDLGQARARLDMAKAELAEMELAERRGELLPVQDVEARLTDEFSQSKTKLLGVPSRARQQDPTLRADQLALLERLIREALEGLADGVAAKSVRRRAAKPARRRAKRAAK